MMARGPRPTSPKTAGLTECCGCMFSTYKKVAQGLVVNWLHGHGSSRMMNLMAFIWLSLWHVCPICTLLPKKYILSRQQYSLTVMTSFSKIMSSEAVQKLFRNGLRNMTVQGVHFELPRYKSDQAFARCARQKKSIQDRDLLLTIWYLILPHTFRGLVKSMP